LTEGIVLRPYRALLGLHGARGLIVAGLIGRFPLSMLGLGTVLLVRAHSDSYALPGLVSGTLAIATAAAGPLSGALADRWGQRRLLAPLLAVFAISTSGLVVAATSPEAEWLLFPVAVVAGATVPQIGSMARRRWKHMIGDGSSFNTALSLESVVDAGVFVIGPVLAAFLAASVWAGAGVLTSTGLAVIGGALLMTQRTTEPPSRVRGTDGGTKPVSPPTYRVAGAWVLVAAHLMLGICFGSSDLSVIAFAQLSGHSAMAGTMLAAFAIGSVIAGAAYGAISWRRSLSTRFAVALLSMAVLSISLVLSPTIVVMAVCALIYGMAVSPALIGGTGLMASLVAADRLTEGFAWLTAAIGLGIAVGAALAGQLIDAYGPNHAFLLTTGAAATGTLIALIGRRWLSPAHAPRRG
jgi:MFS family permease